MIADSAVRTLIARVIGGLVVAGAAFSLFVLSISALGYGILLYALPAVVIGIATLLGQRWARSTLSILLP